ncbi:MAG: hypothetical protein DWQ47_00760 [Acidobacteria bacterium]|nr:MAG: hypothetical protein DWQ32_11220 [Acidobacteriota bacterium]REK04036.1 MAG: hypothetical protein DWQ38_00745 [Acidobacteriota bacterium]REK15198.1 MAG: hypothetical protein DWQ43_16910 [Acidobacteriota bacterium]REK46288.1 MAG: hypothetical protein DWQ47_00760 [Acidobacteriota bacterium]
MSNDLNDFYRSVEERTSKLESLHDKRLNCKKGCSSCCVDGISVFEIEAKNIRERNPGLLSSGEPFEKGACAFLGKQGECRIYNDRPYVCRTQGLPLRWLEVYGGKNVEYRDICPLNEEGEPIESLESDGCLAIGEFEGRLATLQERQEGNLRRVLLRDMFSKS